MGGFRAFLAEAAEVSMKGRGLRGKAATAPGPRSATRSPSGPGRTSPGRRASTDEAAAGLMARLVAAA